MRQRRLFWSSLVMSCAIHLGLAPFIRWGRGPQATALARSRYHRVKILPPSPRAVPSPAPAAVSSPPAKAPGRSRRAKESPSLEPKQAAEARPAGGGGGGGSPVSPTIAMPQQTGPRPEKKRSLRTSAPAHPPSSPRTLSAAPVGSVPAPRSPVLSADSGSRSGPRPAAKARPEEGLSHPATAYPQPGLAAPLRAPATSDAGLALAPPTAPLTAPLPAAGAGTERGKARGPAVLPGASPAGLQVPALDSGSRSAEAAFPRPTGLAFDDTRLALRPQIAGGRAWPDHGYRARSGRGDAFPSEEGVRPVLVGRAGGWVGGSGAGPGGGTGPSGRGKVRLGEEGMGPAGGTGGGFGSGWGAGQGAGEGPGSGSGRGEGQGSGVGPGQGSGEGPGEGSGKGGGEGQGIGPGKGQGSVAVDEETEGYTGLIIVALGLGVSPSPAASVRAENGQAIYGRESSYPGVASFPPSLSSAKSLSKVGKNPLVVYAVGKVDDQWDRDVLISNSDAAKILEANKVGKFLEKFNVAIVVERKKRRW